MRRSAASAIATVLLGFSPAHAAPWRLHVGAGPAFPAGGADFQEALATGFVGTVALGTAVSPALEILVRGTYSDFPRDDEGALLVAGIDRRPFRVLEISGGTLTAWDAWGELRYVLSPGAAVVHPYVLGAAGLTSYRYERVDIAYAYAGHTWPATIPGQEATAACLAGGGGVRFAMRAWLDLTVETRLHVVLRGDGALWSVPLWLEVGVSP